MKLAGRQAKHTPVVLIAKSKPDGNRKDKRRTEEEEEAVRAI